MGKNSKIILAIETSCDETAASILQLEKKPKVSFPKVITLSSVVKSQIKLHSKMGGVVPEAAARAHVKYIRPVVERAIHNSGLNIHDIDYIAVTVGPGLISSLIVGVEFAKALSFATKKPIIPVNHLAGHLYSPLGQIKDEGLKIKDIFPMISLIVSGGHTILVLMENEKKYKVLGETVDDAAGEAFDKVAKLLKLPYPGGPEISKLAQDGDPYAIVLPRPMLKSENFNFSFSGLKTAVYYYYVKYHPLISESRDLSKKEKQDICASFQQAVIDVLIAKTLRAARKYKAKSISLSGGVAANKSLRHQLGGNSKFLGYKFITPPMNLCTDNAEMIGLAAAFMLHNGFKPKSYKQIKADANLVL